VRWATLAFRARGDAEAADTADVSNAHTVEAPSADTADASNNDPADTVDVSSAGTAGTAGTADAPNSETAGTVDVSSAESADTADASNTETGDADVRESRRLALRSAWQGLLAFRVRGDAEAGDATADTGTADTDVRESRRRAFRPAWQGLLAFRARGRADADTTTTTNTADDTTADDTTADDTTAADTTADDTTAGTAEAGTAGTADTDVRESRRRGLHPAWQGLLAFAIYLTVFILGFCLSLIGHLNVPQVGQGEVDPNFYIWAWRWWTYAVSHGTNPLYSYQIGAPGGYSLAWATTSPTVAMLMWPVTTTLGPVVSFNLTLVLAPPASAWAAFIVARRITGRFWASLPAGIVFGFNVYELDHEVSGQPNLTVTVLVPLMVYLVLLWWDKRLRATLYVILMTVVLALEFYTFVEAFAETTLLWVAAVLIGLAVAGRGARLAVVRLAGLTCIAYIGAAVLAWPYLSYALKNQPTSFTRQEPFFSLDVSGLVLPRGDRILGMSWWAAAAGHDLSATSYVGIPLLVILLAVVILRWSSGIIRLLAIGFVVIIALACGPNLIVDGNQLTTLAWGGLWSLPFGRSAEPIRLIVFAYLVLGIALSLWLAALSRSRLLRAARWFLGAVALAAILADLPTFAEVVYAPRTVGWTPALYGVAQQTAVPAFFTDGTYQNYLTPGETVVVLSHRGNAAMLFQAYTNFYFKIAGGFINASLSNPDATPAPVEEMSDPGKLQIEAFEAYVHSAHIGAIIVEQSWSEKWMYNFDQLGMQPYSVGGVTVYQLSTMQPVKDPVKPVAASAPSPPFDHR
jgi:hypothetical protein